MRERLCVAHGCYILGTVRFLGLDLSLMTDRHEKWVRVEPGHVIPAGQPHLQERIDAGMDVRVPPESGDWFVDSSWRPPLNLPTESTWGVVIFQSYTGEDKYTSLARQWRLTGGWFHGVGFNGGDENINPENILQFVEFTSEQVQLIEAERAER